MKKPVDITKRHIAFDKVKRTYESCTTYEQLRVANKLHDLFSNIYGYDNEYSKVLDDLSRKMIYTCTVPNTKL